MTIATALLIPLVGGYIAQVSLPVMEDHLRAPRGNKRVVMVLDASGSMSGGSQSTVCPEWAAAHGFGAPPWMFNKNEQLRAGIMGCDAAARGLFDNWASSIDFAIVGFGYSGAYPCGPGTECGYVRLLQDWTRNVTLLENAVDAIPASGNTPMAWGLHRAYEAHQYWTTTTPGTAECDQHFNILMTDGYPNTPVSPAFTTFPCGSPVIIAGDQDHPVDVVGYGWGGPSPVGCNAGINCTPLPGGYPLAGNVDSVCGLNGVQATRTYTVATGASGSFDAGLMSMMATAGGGQYYYASGAAGIEDVFNSILNDITNRTAFFVPPSIQSDGLFLGNTSFNTGVRPTPGGPWKGNLKKYCIEPPVDTAGNYIESPTPGWNLCMFKSVAGVLVTNTQPEDQFSRTGGVPGSGTTSLDADVGGAGEIIYRDFFNGRTPLYNAGGAAAFHAEFGPNYFHNTSGRRNVITWNNSGYKAARPDGPTGLTDDEAFSSGCDKYKMFAYLYGYDPATVDCTQNPPRPTALGEWSIGASANAGSVLLRWGSDCTVVGNCIVAFGADDGGVHFVDAANGHEHAFLVIRELLEGEYVANYPLADVDNQPSAQLSRRPYVDGAVFRVHDDRNGNGIIDAPGSTPEMALLGIGLGRHRGYYFINISNRFPSPSYAPSTALNPVYPLIPVRTADIPAAAAWAENLREMTAKMYIGRVRMPTSPGGRPEIAGVFGSGHVWYLDRPQEQLNVNINGLPPRLSPAAGQFLDCQSGNEFAQYNKFNPSGADFCDIMHSLPGIYECIVSGCPPIPDPAGYDRIVSPLWFARNQGPGQTYARSIGQFHFSDFDTAGPQDYLVFEDLSGNPLSPQYSGDLGNFVADVWINQPFRIRVHTDGIPSFDRGIALDDMQWIPDDFLSNCDGGNPCWNCDADNDNRCELTLGECLTGSPIESLQACLACDFTLDVECRASDGECGLPDRTGCGTHNPFVAAIDLTRINGNTARPFAEWTENGSVRMMFTKTCPPSVSGTCYHQGSAFNTDLQFMNCPIIAEVRGYEEGGVAKAFYVGDQCGQMWKFYTLDSGATWRTKRLFVVNNLVGAGGPVAVGQSRDFRKFDKAVDLAISTCRGGRAIEILWGTGNTARPGRLNDNLNGPTRTTVNGNPVAVAGRDLIGVVFDDNTLNTGASRTIGNLLNLTGTPGGPPPAYNPAALQRGWYIILGANESMYREPLVFNSVAYWKTNQTLTAATTCLPATGLDRIYALDNCTGEPAVPSSANSGAGTTNDRVVWTGDTAIGGGIFLFTPKNNPPIVSSGDASTQTVANLTPQTATNRAIQIYNWRKI